MVNIKPIQSGHSLFLKNKIEALKTAKILNRTPGQVKVGVRKTNHLLRGKGYLIYSGNIWMVRITKFVSRNLYGETRAEEKARLLRERVKAIIAGKSRNISFGAGITKAQKTMRYRILKKSGLPTKTPKYLDIYS